MNFIINHIIYIYFKYNFILKARLPKLGLILSVLIFLNFSFSNPPDTAKRILVFSKTQGYRHDAIPAGITALIKLGKANGFQVDTTENADKINEQNLKRYNAVVFLSTTQNILNPVQQADFERFIQAGGGFLGIHAAADTEYNWKWYNKLVGAYFESHPHQQKAKIKVIDKSHLSTKHLPDTWERFDEWYNYKEINPDIKVLMTLDETSYTGGKNGANHPIAWYHEFDGGRAVYTGLGHTIESYVEADFLTHLLGALQYATGGGALDYKKAHSPRVPEENRFKRIVLTEGLNEPMELAVANDGRVFITERTGALSVWNPQTKSVIKIKQMPVEEKEGNGLLGITLDPNFNTNNQVYLYHTQYNGKQLNHLVSRFVITKDNKIDLTSEKVVIRIPIEFESSAHTGGSMLFDEKGNLWISVGDNTVPSQSDGFSPIDERENVTLDAQRSASNTHDLRGKILRIHPETDGTYTIPDGNLFPKDGSKGKPEIYVMGCRNPYRISYDYKTGFIYWGEIGPDSGIDSVQGPRGYDEFNQAKKPGFFGWPYFVGDNKPYRDKDFATNTLGDFFNPENPVNNSPNNTGVKNLPVAEKPLIWYPYNSSKEFPDVGKGGRSAMAGGIYHYNKDLKSSVKFPEYYNNKFFIMEWMRDWIKVASMDKKGDLIGIEEFLPSMKIDGPIDMQFGYDGAMYLLEYGENYGVNNPDASLVKIEYIVGNRAPLAKITASDTIGSLPMKVNFSANKSKDNDEGDKLSFQWKILESGFVSAKKNFDFTFTKSGIYHVSLIVSDSYGLKSKNQIIIKAGNSLPQVSIALEGNQSFFWPGEKINYKVSVKDKEDLGIDTSKVNIHLNYIKESDKKKIAQQGHQIISIPPGKLLMEQSDCKACHTLATKSAGPAFMEIAKRYPKTDDNLSKLAEKIIKGGSGNWGAHPMAAHPQVSKKDAMEMVAYILSLSEVKEPIKRLPMIGEIVPSEEALKSSVGFYLMSASYTDKGGKGLGSLTNTAFKTIKNPIILAANYDGAKEVDVFPSDGGGKHCGAIGHGSHLLFKDIDLTMIAGLHYMLSSKNYKGKIELHLDSPEGLLIGTAHFLPNKSWENWTKFDSDFKETEGVHDLYFVFKEDGDGRDDLCSLRSIIFHK